MTNTEEVREEMKKSNVFQWEVADQIGISEATFTRWLRYEVSDERKQKIMKAIRACKTKAKGRKNQNILDLEGGSSHKAAAG